MKLNRPHWATLGLTLVLLSGALHCSNPTPAGEPAAGTNTTSVGAGGSMGSNTAASASTLGVATSGTMSTTVGTGGGIMSGMIGSGATGGASPTTAGNSSSGGAGGIEGSADGTVNGAGGSTGGAGGSTSTGSGGAESMGNDRPKRVLLYSFSTLDIPSVPAQLEILEGHLAGWSYEVDRSTDPSVFTDTSLANYAAVGMINTCFSPFGVDNPTGDIEAQALQRFLQDGGGLFGTHCADVTFQSATPPVLYNQILGGRASSDNFEGVSNCRRTSEHASAAGLPEAFSYDGNLDNTNFLADDIQILVRCTWGNPAGTDVAVSWVRNEGPGRVFFTNFGKVDVDLTNATIGEPHIIAGLAWVLGI